MYGLHEQFLAAEPYADQDNGDQKRQPCKARDDLLLHPVQHLGLVEADGEAGIGAGQLHVAENPADAVEAFAREDALWLRRHRPDHGMILELAADRPLLA